MIGPVIWVKITVPGEIETMLNKAVDC